MNCLESSSAPICISQEFFVIFLTAARSNRQSHQWTGRLLAVGMLGAMLLPMSAGRAETSSPARSELFNSTVDRLPVEERNILRSGQPLVTGDQGIYKAQVLVNAPIDTAWSVLTDYANLARFIPNMISSQVLKDEGNRKIVEQIDSRQVFVVNVKSRIKSSLVETPKSRIDFQLVDGDLQNLRGYWQIEPIAPYNGAQPNQVLITQVVEAKPNDGVPTAIFNSLFKESLTSTLSAIGQETLRRYH
jgi:ribosome-associated toxin RatA of RatAB toxin-antitoxin module